MNKKPLEKIDATRGLVGFKCPKSGRNEEFSFCWSKCMNHCKPPTFLMSLSKGYRPVEENVYHVTEILNPPQIVYLTRNNPYYVEPDALVDMHVGTAWHSKIEEVKGFVKELGLEHEYLMEKNFRIKFLLPDDLPKGIKSKKPWVVKGSVLGLNDTTLSGTSDLYIHTTKTLWDFKTMKYYYTFKYLTEGKWEDSNIPWQMNIYRVYQYPKCAKMKILAYIKDWKSNFPDRYGVGKTDIIEVPRMPDEVVEKRVIKLLTEHVTAQKTGTYRECTEDERWINRDGVALRCRDYCAASDLCEQNNE